jgi:hypothetical protein
MPRRFAIAAGPSSALVFAGDLRLGDTLALPLQHDLPLPVATPARIVSMSLLVELRVSSRSPPIGQG